MQAAAPVRSLHSSRAALGKHVLESEIATTWSEIPRGGITGSSLTPEGKKKAVWKIWYNHAVVPLYVTIVVAGGVCSFFMYKYFTYHTEIAWSKSMRGTYDHSGLSDARATKHTDRLLYSGMMDRNKNQIQVFPFNFIPMKTIAQKRYIDYDALDAEE